MLRNQAGNYRATIQYGYNIDNMANEIILVGDVHANELKVLNWQLKCNSYKSYLPIKVLDYLDTFTPKDVDMKKVVRQWISSQI